MPGDEKTESATCSSATTSELNNLLQTISGTASLIEDIWSGSDSSKKYFAMLRESIERAEKITAQLAQQSGGANKKLLLHLELAALARPKPLPSPPVRSKPSILIVDDEPMAAMLMKRTLTNAGFQVATARSGFEGLDLVRRRHRELG